MGRIAEGIEIPLVAISRFPFLLDLVPAVINRLRKARAVLKEMPEYVSATPAWCRGIREQIQQAVTRAELIELWRETLEPYYYRSCWMLRVSAKLSVDLTPEVHGELAEPVGEADANALLLHMSHDADLGSDSGFLASLGPALGETRVARGEISREEYLERSGHRRSQECELSAPRPYEDPDWLDRQLAQLAESPSDVDKLLARRRAEFDAAWRWLQARYPSKAQSLRRRMDQVAEAAQRREAVRSEFTRVTGVIRAFALCAGQLTGLGDGAFFLQLDELLDALAGGKAAARNIPDRRETYARYCALPPYPGLIRGRFDPFAWAADPNQRSDFYDSQRPVPVPDSKLVTGFPGAAGRVEGLVRRLDSTEEGAQFLAGGILATTTTNIGWTPLFPRAGAVVTDVGAPLSHAAIVARELGIPAVVGCGNATMHLRTGDRVLVDGGRGTDEILEQA